MKLLLISFLATCHLLINAQNEWLGAGSNNATDLIYRTGTVGVGTTSSANGKMQIYGDFILSRNNGAFVFTNAYQNGEHFLSIAPNSGGTYSTTWEWDYALGFNGNTGELHKSAATANDIAFAVRIGSQRNFQVLGDGRVIIGNVTAPTGYKLYVEDGILAERIKVALPTSTTHWADFVFNDNYKLRSIKSLEKFVNENNHLPDMPSGEELYKSGGIDVTEMFKLQQQKIEELTLYIIQLNKRINQLESK